MIDRQEGRHRLRWRHGRFLIAAGLRHIDLAKIEIGIGVFLRRRRLPCRRRPGGSRRSDRGSREFTGYLLDLGLSRSIKDLGRRSRSLLGGILAGNLLQFGRSRCRCRRRRWYWCRCRCWCRCWCRSRCRSRCRRGRRSRCRCRRRRRLRRRRRGWFGRRRRGAGFTGLWNGLLTESPFQSPSDINGRCTGLLLGGADNTLVQLHYGFASTFLGRQFKQSFRHLIGNVLNHVDFVLGPGPTIITLLQNDAAMGAVRTTQGNAQKRLGAD